MKRAILAGKVMAVATLFHAMAYTIFHETIAPLIFG